VYTKNQAEELTAKKDGSSRRRSRPQEASGV